MTDLDAMKREIADACGCEVMDTHQAAQVALDASYQASDFELMSNSQIVTRPGGFGHWYREMAVIRIKKASFDMTRKEREAR